jgi:hypothetical protein
VIIGVCRAYIVRWPFIRGNILDTRLIGLGYTEDAPVSYLDELTMFNITKIAWMCTHSWLVHATLLRRETTRLVEFESVGWGLRGLGLPSFLCFLSAQNLRTEQAKWVLQFQGQASMIWALSRGISYVLCNLLVFKIIVIFYFMTGSFFGRNRCSKCQLVHSGYLKKSHLSKR